MCGGGYPQVFHGSAQSLCQTVGRAFSFDTIQSMQLMEHH